jgi:hypothetical protein
MLGPTWESSLKFEYTTTTKAGESGTLIDTGNTATY